MSTPTRRTIQTDYLASVEGEGAMSVRLVDGKVDEVELRIFEPPRFFEALLRGRSFLEAPDITSRICGICPVAYQMSSINAMEDLCGVEVSEPIRLLRRLLYCGEWIESHALHVYMLHAPDFLGYDGAVEMAREHPDVVQRGLQLKKTGNELMIVDRRPRDPSGEREGGRLLPRADAGGAAELVEPLERAREAAVETVRWTAGFDFPERAVECELVALAEPDAYAIEQGRVVSDHGLDIGVQEYDDHFYEEHVARSNALHSTSHGRRARTFAARSPATRSAPTASRRSRARWLPRSASRFLAETPSAASSSAASSSSTPATRRCG